MVESCNSKNCGYGIRIIKNMGGFFRKKYEIIIFFRLVLFGKFGFAKGVNYTLAFENNLIKL